MSAIKIWNRLFLEERSSISLSLFRVFVALTTGLHVLPSFVHLNDNYLSTALKQVNLNFFPLWAIDLVQKSPDWLVLVFVGLFIATWLSFLVGFMSQISCIAMTLCCYYFYALNDFHIGTLSWDILLVTLFLMCITKYHGDYFSVDALRRGNMDAYKTPRPFFIQRLLQLQLASTFFFTALYKITGEGNWITGNPLYYLMNYPPSGVTKNFLLKEVLAHHPSVCYVIGLVIIIMELSLPFLLFIPRSRRSAIVLGFIFHVALVLILDVPTIFLFLFPAQMLLFVNPDHILDWIKDKRAVNALSPRTAIIYDADCGFCKASIERLKLMDLFNRLEYVPGPVGLSEMRLVAPNGRRYGGFYAFRQLCFLLPMLYPLIIFAYLPFMGTLGSWVYRWIAQNRFFLPFRHTCASSRCSG